MERTKETVEKKRENEVKIVERLMENCQKLKKKILENRVKNALVT